MNYSICRPCTLYFVLTCRFRETLDHLHVPNAVFHLFRNSCTSLQIAETFNFSSLTRDDSNYQLRAAATSHLHPMSSLCLCFSVKIFSKGFTTGCKIVLTRCFGIYVFRRRRCIHFLRFLWHSAKCPTCYIAWVWHRNPKTFWRTRTQTETQTLTQRPTETDRHTQAKIDTDKQN